MPISRTMEPTHLSRAARARFREGTAACAECIDLAVNMYKTHFKYPRGERVTYEAAALAERFADIVSGGRDDPKRAGFIMHLNTGFPRLFMRLVDFETSLDLANSVNRGSYPAYATVYGRRGVADIAVLENRPPPIPVPSAVADDDASTVETAPISVAPARLAERPDFFDLPPGDAERVFREGSPRAHAALRWSAGMFLQINRGRTAEMTLTEYGPRRAVGAMVLGARMGMQVRWREREPQPYLHTVHQVATLPALIRNRISFVPDAPYAPTDITLWNMPWTGTPFHRMSAAVDSGGILMVQSEEALLPYRDGWRCFADIDIPPGEHILPSAFLHIAPRTFQVWCDFR